MATTLSQKAIVARGGWAEAILKELPDEEYRKSGAYPPLKVATKWMDHLSESLRPKATIVLVAGELLPEETSTGRRPERGRQHGGPVQSRTFFPVGAYWDAEKIVALLRKRKLFLDVVAPETRFGNCCALQEMPQLPWVARPVVGPVGTLRFTARFAGRISDFYNTDLPSGYGVWCYARTAAATGGKYLLYPFPGGDWLDACPFDPELRANWREKKGMRSLRSS